MTKKKLTVAFLTLRRSLKFKNMPISALLIICFFFVFALIILLSAASFSFYKTDKESSTLEIIKQSTLQAQNKIDDFMSDLNSITKFPLTAQLNNHHFLDGLEQFNRTESIDLSFQSTTQQMFSNIFIYKKQIQSVFLFNLQGKGEYSMPIGGSIFKDFNPLEYDWFQQSIDNFGKPVIINTFSLPNAASIDGKPINVFSMARGIVRLDPARVIGVLLVNVNLDFISDICEKMLIVPDQQIIIIDKTGNIVYDTFEANIAKSVQPDLYNLVSDKTRDTANLKMDSSDMLISYQTSGLTDWTIINIVPEKELNRGLYKMRNTTVVITLIIIFLASIIVYSISKQIVKPLKRLISIMRLVEKGDFDVKIKLDWRNELGILARSFNTMTKKLHRLINDVYVNQIKQKEFELQMLQNQINPHFLYNTLESISMMSQINHDNESSEMAAALGKILRYGINQNKATVTVREELDHLKDYIMLQEMRFSSIFKITLDVCPDLENKSIIKLILQPLVENAIYHGMNDRVSGGLIQVSGYLEENNIIFEITDNGSGMDENQTKLLNDYINGLNNSFKSIGLKNVNKRIQLHYGDDFGVDYGIKIFSTLNLGTTVKLTIPVLS